MQNQPVNISIEQALTNIDTVCANANGNRETHLVLLGSLAVIKSELDQKSVWAEKLAALSEENDRLREQLIGIYADDTKALANDAEAGQVINGEFGGEA